jgi:hypothetical protein
VKGIGLSFFERERLPMRKIMEMPEKLLEVLKKDGVVAIATLGPDGPHMVNTWNSYIRVSEDGRLLIPAGYFHKTEANIAVNDKVLVTLGSSKVQGLNGPGTGFLIKGTAAFVTAGPDFEATKARFGWARAALAITIDSATQTI